MQIERTKITPRMAASWLETVPPFQRKLSDRQVARLVIAITRGEWRENGATIVFNSKNELIDGQHRLKAISVAGMPVWGIVIRNVSPGEETFQTIDDGKARSVNDFIMVPHANVTASVLRHYWCVMNGFFPSHKIVAPHTDVLQLGRPYMEYISSLVSALDQAGRVTGQTAFITFLVFYHTKIYPVPEHLLSTFFARVGDGVELRPSDPAYQLRQRFLSVPKTGAFKRMNAQALILKALNFALDEKPCGHLVWADKEDFPPLRGYKRGTGLQTGKAVPAPKKEIPADPAGTAREAQR